MPRVSLNAAGLSVNLIGPRLASNGPRRRLSMALGRGADILRALQPPSESADIIILGSYAQNTGACVHRWGGGVMSDTRILKITARLHKGKRSSSVRPAIVICCHRYSGNSSRLRLRRRNQPLGSAAEIQRVVLPRPGCLPVSISLLTENISHLKRIIIDLRNFT